MSTNGLHGSPGLLQCLRDTYNVVGYVYRNVELYRKNMRIASRKVNAMNRTRGNCSNFAMTYTGAPSISHLALFHRPYITPNFFHTLPQQLLLGFI